MNKKLKVLLSYLAIVLGALMASFSVACILLPNDAIDYGTAGIAIIISKLTGYNLSLCVLLVFLPFLIAGIFFLGKKFFVRVFIGFVVYTIGLAYFEKIPFELNTEHFLAVAFGGAILGIGLSLILRNGGCIDGSEIFANIIVNKIFNKTGKDYSISYILIGFNVIVYIAVFILIFVGVIANVQGTMFTRDLIDKYITPFLLSDGTPNFSPLAHAIERVAVFYGIGIVATYAYNRIMINVTQGMMMNMRNELFEHMEKLPIKYFDTHAHGDIMSIYTNDIDTLRQMVSQSIPQIINSGFTIISVFVSMLILNIPLTVVTMIMVAIMIFGTKKAAGQSGKYFLEQQKNLGKVNGYIEEMMNGQKVVKVFCHEEESKAEFKELNEALFVSADRANTYANYLGPLNAQIGNISYVVCAIVGGALALNGVGGFTLGALASFLTFNKSFSMPINQVSQQMNAIVMALAGAERIFTLLDEKVEVDDGYVTLVNVKKENGKLIECKEHTRCWAWKHTHQADGSVDYIELKGNVVFDGVDFGYNNDKIVLHDVKLYAEPGQKIAFVGSTGAGKTTITNLINRFYDIQDGKIRYDGININKIRKADLRRSLGIVLQDTHLFTGTVKDNIRFGKLDATDEEIFAAAELANADGFIRRLPEGYDTVITGDGANLSQGQRQLLAIARAAVADPPVLILDEATSSIDTRTESIVQKGMDNLMKGRTVFVIAHRLSTIRDADEIIVITEDGIAERGTHEELLDMNGVYAAYYNM